MLFQSKFRLYNPVLGARLLRYPSGQIYQWYGENKALYMAAVGLNGHNGIDIVASQRTPILATKGKVVDIKQDIGGYGKHVRIATDLNSEGYCFVLAYGHLDTINPDLKLGQRVEDGQQIGTMGNTGFVISGGTPYWGNAPAGKGVHLHFGARLSTDKPTKWRYLYKDGTLLYGVNIDNGIAGYVDPYPYLPAPEDLVRLVQSAAGMILALQMKLEEFIKGRQSKP